MGPRICRAPRRERVTTFLPPAPGKDSLSQVALQSKRCHAERLTTSLGAPNEQRGEDRARTLLKLSFLSFLKPLLTLAVLGGETNELRPQCCTEDIVQKVRSICFRLVIQEGLEQFCNAVPASKLATHGGLAPPAACCSSVFGSDALHASTIA